MCQDPNQIRCGKFAVCLVVEQLYVVGFEIFTAWLPKIIVFEIKEIVISSVYVIEICSGFENSSTEGELWIEV